MLFQFLHCHSGNPNFPFEIIHFYFDPINLRRLINILLGTFGHTLKFLIRLFQFIIEFPHFSAGLVVLDNYLELYFVNAECHFARYFLILNLL